MEVLGLQAATAARAVRNSRLFVLVMPHGIDQSLGNFTGSFWDYVLGGQSPVGTSPNIRWTSGNLLRTLLRRAARSGPHQPFRRHMGNRRFWNTGRSIESPDSLKKGAPTPLSGLQARASRWLGH